MAKSNKKWPVIAGVGFIGVFVALMAWSTFGNDTYKVELCMTYNGRTVCRNGAGASEDSAQRVARDGACTDLTHGMTELVQCQNSQPASLTWKK